MIKLQIKITVDSVYIGKTTDLIYKCQFEAQVAKVYKRLQS